MSRHAAILMFLALGLSGGLNEGSATAALVDTFPSPVNPVYSLAARLHSAAPGDTLLLHPGTYRGTFTLRSGVSLMGIAGPDSTIFDAAGERYCLFGRGIDSTTTIAGLTLQNGRRPHANSGGGGIYLHQSSPRIINNVFRDHLGYLGPGVYTNYGCRPVIAFNVFRDNAGYLGGAISAYQDCAPLVYNNLIFDNSAVSGGGILALNSCPVIYGNTIVGNSASSGGGGIYCDSSPALIAENILAHNLGEGAVFQLDDDAPATLRGNQIWENEGGSAGGVCPEYVGTDGNFRSQPHFLDQDRPGHLPEEEMKAGAHLWLGDPLPDVPDSVLTLWRDWVRNHVPD
jgi:hypothetical protein